MGTKVSVIIPSYNYGQYLDPTLNSVLEQTTSDWECLVVDDGSTDHTAAIVAEWSRRDPRFRYLHQNNQGQATARNLGLQHARGEYIQFFDSDDLLQPDKLRIQSAWLDAHPETDIVYGRVRYFETGKETQLFIDRWGERMTEWMPMLSGKGEPMIRAFADKNILEMGCALFRREAVDLAGGFDKSMTGIEDYDFCFRAAAKGLSFTFLDADSTAVLMRHHPNSYSKNRIKVYRVELELRRKMDEVLTKNGYRQAKEINDERYGWRMRRLQDLLIDRTIKQQGKRPDNKELGWMYKHSSLKQNLYFFPRILKAMVAR